MSALPAALEGRLVRALLGLPERVQRAVVRRPLVRDGRRLATETQLLLWLEKAAREPGPETLPYAEGRRALSRQAAMIGGRQPIGALRDLTVDGAEGPLRARLYIPTERSGAAPAPTLLYVHGGGWVYGDLDAYDATCRHLAEQSGVQVLSLDYRLAPEHPWPAAADDAVAAYRWLVAHADEVGADPDRLGVGGDSAGGHLAAQVALTAAREGLPLAVQLLVYPATDFSERTRSRELFNEGFYLTEQFMAQCQEWYLGDHDPADPAVSPLLADLPEGVSPAIVVTAGFDPLRDEGQAYAARLAAHGVPVEATEARDMIHGFFSMVGAGRAAPAHNRRIAALLRAALAGER